MLEGHVIKIAHLPLEFILIVKGGEAPLRATSRIARAPLRSVSIVDNTLCVCCKMRRCISWMIPAVHLAMLPYYTGREGRHATPANQVSFGSGLHLGALAEPIVQYAVQYLFQLSQMKKGKPTIPRGARRPPL